MKKSLVAIASFFLLSSSAFASTFSLSPQYLNYPEFDSTIASEAPVDQYFVFQGNSGAWCGNTLDENFSTSLIVSSCFGDTQNLFIVSVQNPGDGFGDCATDFTLCLEDATHYVSSQGWTTLYFGPVPPPPPILPVGSMIASVTQSVGSGVGGALIYILKIFAVLVALGITISYIKKWIRGKGGGTSSGGGSSSSGGKFMTQSQISREFPAMTQGFKSGQGF